MMIDVDYTEAIIGSQLMVMPNIFILFVHMYKAMKIFLFPSIKICAKMGLQCFIYDVYSIHSGGQYDRKRPSI